MWKLFPFIMELKTNKQKKKERKKKNHTTAHCIFPKVIKYNLETTIQPSKNFSTLAETRTKTFLVFLEVILATDFTWTPPNWKH